MPRRARRPVSHEPEAGWLSIGDMMSGLMLFFVLLYVVVLLQLTEQANAQQDRRRIIIGRIAEALAAAEIEVGVDEKTGDVSIKEDILFAEGSAYVGAPGRDFLERFIPVYASVIQDDPMVEQEVVQVIVEGHTSSKGSYASNLSLSLDRADAVAQYVISEDVDFPQKQAFLTKLTPAGRGEIDAAEEDSAEDRRVMFRLRFAGDEFLVSWLELLGDPE